MDFFSRIGESISLSCRIFMIQVSQIKMHWTQRERNCQPTCGARPPSLLTQRVSLSLEIHCSEVTAERERERDPTIITIKTMIFWIWWLGTCHATTRASQNHLPPPTLEPSSLSSTTSLSRYGSQWLLVSDGWRKPLATDFILINRINHLEIFDF